MDVISAAEKLKVEPGAKLEQVEAAYNTEVRAISSHMEMLPQEHSLRKKLAAKLVDVEQARITLVSAIPASGPGVTSAVGEDFPKTGPQVFDFSRASVEKSPPSSNEQSEKATKVVLSPSPPKSRLRFWLAILLMVGGIGVASWKTYAQAMVTVITEPAGARVWLDGEEMGATTANIAGVPTGSHVLEVKKEGFLDITQTIDVEAQNNQTLTFRLEREVRIETNPAEGVEVVSADGTKLATSFGGAIVLQLPVRNHKLTFSKEGYLPKTLDLRVRSSEATNVSKVQLAFDGGVLKVETFPADAEVFVDDRQVVNHSQPLYLKAGSHRLRVTQKGYVPESLTVELTKGKPLKKVVRLEKGAHLEVVATPPDAKVMLYSGPSDQVGRRVDRPESKGRVVLDLLRPGVWEIVVSKAGYVEEYKAVELVPGQGKKLEFRLEEIPSGSGGETGTSTDSSTSSGSQGGVGVEPPQPERLPKSSGTFDP